MPSGQPMAVAHVASKSSWHKPPLTYKDGHIGEDEGATDAQGCYTFSRVNSCRSRVVDLFLLRTFRGNWTKNFRC